VLFDEIQRTDSNGEKTGLACLVERSLPRTVLSALKENQVVFLEDGDELIMEGWCVNKKNGARFGFGQCRGTVTPAVKLRH
jgi:fumarylacetoacetase